MVLRHSDLQSLSVICYFFPESVGCDFKIGSTKKFDDCGVCAGDGKSCKAVKTRKNIEATRSMEYCNILFNFIVSYYTIQ